MKKLFTLMLFVYFTININAQKNEPQKAFVSTKVTSMTHVTSIASRPQDQLPVDMSEREAQDGRSKNNPKIIIGKDPQRTNDYFTLNPNNLEQKIKGKAPSLVFDAASSNSQPTDPALAVGPNHVFVVFNTGFRIFAKDGTPLTGQISPNPAIFPSSGCCDLTVSYDNDADRWVVTFLGSGMQVAVSDGPDPVNDGWYVYNVAAVSDYNKLSVWRDGYYVTQNTGGGTKVFALERDKMLLGDGSAQVVGFSLPGIVTSGFNSAQAFNISNDNFPTSGDIAFVYMQDDAWGGVSQDHIKLWTLNMNWGSGNGTMSAASQINTTPFISVFDGGAWDNIQQPGGSKLDALQATIMNQAQFRKFGDHNSALFNFVVDTDASGGKLAGVRWIELRQANDTAPWTLYQEGTYTAANGKHAWNASLIMDDEGNIGLGYSACAGTNNKRVGMYYTGRFANDPLGTMSVAEEIILEGNANIPGGRYGDYSKIDIDPTDDKTFWFADEMMNSGRKDVVGVFKLELLVNDMAVLSIDAPVVGGVYGGSEAVTITVSNLGDSTQSNIPVSYTINGNTVNEVISGSINAGASLQYTFLATANMSGTEVYNLETCTNLVGDENSSNDCLDIVLNQLDLCIPIANDGDTGSNTGCNLDGIKHFVLGTIDIDDGGDGCNNEGTDLIKGYADRRDLSTDLDLSVGTHILQSQMNWADGINGPEQLSVWIDFNDDGTFAVSEQLISGETFTAANELVSFDLVLPIGAALGSHTLRARCIDTTGTPGDPNDPCANYQYGETHDYTVNIVQSSSVSEGLFNDSDFVISTLENNQFNITVSTTEITERLNFSVTNLLGQKLLSYYLDNIDGSYKYHLDMSYATPGVYLLRLGNSEYGNIKKIVVK